MDDAPDAEIPPEWARAMLAKIVDPDLQQRLSALAEVANFDIDEEIAAPFLRFHTFVTEPEPSYITQWRADPKLESKWYQAHVNGILGNVRGGLAAAYYHASNLRAIESQIAMIFDGFDFKKLGSSGIGIGRTRKIDIEYHAFILSCRRSLDYLALSLGAYFKTEINSFRTLPRAIAKTKKPAVAEQIIMAHGRHTDALNFLLSDGKTSVRNRIAHYDFVSAGTPNISAHGLCLFGGAEDLGRETIETQLSEALNRRLNSLSTCIQDMIDSFIAAVKGAEI